ncbi:hypothetical protein [Rhodopseudomonas telluris]|uniref:Uncharacterized protein n=1 Tax=Rhodopseudomonas telluris TaxID=644215 RepID=A0ABV6ENV0_9BRAD
MRISAPLIGLVLALGGVSSAVAGMSQQRSSYTESYTHNGSAVAMEFNGDSVTIVYAAPRPGLASVGVREGTILFTGRRIGARVDGVAYVFKAGCSPAPYEVSGRFDGRENLILSGPAPRWDPRSCAIIGYTQATRHSQLVFLEAYGDI